VNYYFFILIEINTSFWNWIDFFNHFFLLFNKLFWLRIHENIRFSTKD